ncbi:hypothetical protein D3C71_1835000 [compost metagenome]
MQDAVLAGRTFDGLARAGQEQAVGRVGGDGAAVVVKQLQRQDLAIVAAAVLGHAWRGRGKRGGIGKGGGFRALGGRRGRGEQERTGQQ